MNEPDDDLLRAWLLHRLRDETVIAVFEQRLLEDDAFGALVRAIEDDLFDDYTRGRLDTDDRAAVARWLIATAHDRARVRFARALGLVDAHGDGRAREPRPRRALRPALRDRPLPWRRLAMFGAAVAAAVLAAVSVQVQRPTTSLAKLAANAPTITLLASLQRGSSVPVLIASVPRAAALRLQVEVTDEDATARYRVHIATGSRRLYESPALAAQTVGRYRFVEVALAPVVFGDGDYHVEVVRDGGAQPLQEWIVRTRLR